jgi:hypothetical protein
MQTMPIRRSSLLPNMAKSHWSDPRPNRLRSPAPENPENPENPDPENPDPENPDPRIPDPTRMRATLCAITPAPAMFRPASRRRPGR